MISIVIVDDHPVVRAALRALLEREHDIAIVGEACSGSEAIRVVRRVVPRVVLMEHSMPGIDGPTATRALAELVPDTRVVLLVTLEGPVEIERGRTAGAVFVVRKDAPRGELVRIVRAARGDRYVLPRASAPSSASSARARSRPVGRAG